MKISRKNGASRSSNTEPRQDVSPCRLARRRLFGPTGPQHAKGRWSLGAGISVDSPWIQRHISVCPRCQKRFSGLGNVLLGLNLMKSQAHSLDLLKRANHSAVNVLKHDLRDSRKAIQLKTSLPTLTLAQRLRWASHGLCQMAACIAILVLSKIGVFSSIDRVQKQGQTTVKHFFDCKLGSDLSDDLFSDA